MKLSLRDMFWLILTLGIGLAWYVHSFAGQADVIPVREGEMIAIVSKFNGFSDEHSTTLVIVSSVSRERLQVDGSIGPGLPAGIAFNAAGQCLGLSYQDGENGVGYVRRINTFEIEKIQKRLREVNR